MLLGGRDISASEHAAILDAPRPGVWLQGYTDQGPSLGDGRVLSQEQTDALIACELIARFNPTECDEILPAIRIYLRRERFGRDHNGDQLIALQQRGGIHSDELVRLLAFRAWGDRDRHWRPFKTPAPRSVFGSRDAVMLTARVSSLDFHGRELT